MSKSKKEMYKSIYKLTYIANINKSIDEANYISVLQRLGSDGFKTYHVDNFYQLTQQLHIVGLYDSFNVSLLIHMRDIIYKQLADVALNFEDIGAIFSYKKYNMIKRIRMIQKTLKVRLEMIKAFKKLDMTPASSNVLAVPTDELLKSSDKSLQSTKGDSKFPKQVPKMTVEDVNNFWQFHLRNDVLDRLHLLAQTHFTLDELNFMGVELKLVTEVENMNLDDLRNYYMRVVRKIDNSLKKWMDLCREYINIEINYTECCDNMNNNKPTMLTVPIDKLDVLIY